jgi:hypothetical protein
MPTTRPGFIWSGTEWVAIGQEAVVNPFYYQATAPTGAATGAIWIESDVDVPSIDSSQFLRWRKTMAGGETSLSGNDDSSLPLAYTPGYEQLYINGVLQVRGGDYTATTGTTVTGLTALVANDVVEIFSAVARTVADVYTQTQSDARFASQVNFPSGAWIPFTPTWSSFTPGNATVSCFYTQQGKTVTYTGSVTLGTTSSVGTNFVNVSIPVPQKRGQQIGSVAYTDSGVATIGGTFVVQASGLGAFQLTNTTSNFGSMGTNFPFTWGANDFFSWTVTYEAA